MRGQARHLGRAGGRARTPGRSRRCRTRGRPAPSPTRSRTRRPYSSGARARSSSPVISSKPSSRARGQVAGARRAGRACPASSERSGSEQALLHRAPEHGAVEEALAVVVVPGVGVGVEQHERQRLAGRLGVGAQLAEHDRVVAAEHDRRRPRPPSSGCEALGDLLHRALRVAGRDVEVAPVDHRLAGEHVHVERAGGRAAAASSPRGSPRGRSAPRRGRRWRCRTARPPPPRPRRAGRARAGSARRCARPCSAARARRPAARSAARSLHHHPDGAQPAVGRAAQAAAVVERRADVVERLGGQALAGQHVGDAGRVGGERLRRDPARRLARRAPPPAGRGRPRAARARARPTAAAARTPRAARSPGASSASTACSQRRRPAAAPCSRDRLGHAEHRDHHVLAEQLEVHVVALAHEAPPARSRSRRCRARRSRAAAGRRRARRARPPAARRARRGPGRRARRRAAPPARPASPRAARGPRTAACRRAASSEPVSSELGLVDSTSVTQRSTTSSSISAPLAQVDDRRLGEAAHDLVHARDHEVRAAGERVLGQLVAEGEVRAPGLVDHQRDAVRVGHLGQPADVGDRAEVGRATPRWRPPRPGCARAPRRAARGSCSGRSGARGRARGRRTPAAARTGPARRSCSSARCAGPRPRPRRARARAAPRGCPATRR